MKNETCKWKVDLGGVLEAFCGSNFFEFNEYGPVENHFKFCPYCGLEIKAKKVKK